MYVFTLNKLHEQYNVVECALSLYHFRPIFYRLLSVNASDVSELVGRYKTSFKMEVLNMLKNTVANVLPGNPITREIDVGNHRASAGSGLLWKIYDGVTRNTRQVCGT